jgi:hypothetical protein
MPVADVGPNALDRQRHALLFLLEVGRVQPIELRVHVPFVDADVHPVSFLLPSRTQQEVLQGLVAEIEVVRSAGVGEWPAQGLEARGRLVQDRVHLVGCDGLGADRRDISSGRIELHGTLSSFLRTGSAAGDDRGQKHEEDDSNHPQVLSPNGAIRHITPPMSVVC